MKKYYKAEFTFSLPEGHMLSERELEDAMFEGFPNSSLNEIEVFHVHFKEEN